MHVAAVAHIPWTIKPLFGILSDGFPIYNLKRTYYIIIASAVGTVAWLLLGLVPVVSGIAIILMLFGNLAMALPQVMFDAANAVKSQTYPEHASDLQSFPYGAFSFFAIIGYLSSGWLILAMGTDKLFLLITITSFPIGYGAFKGLLGEGKTTFVYIDPSSRKNSSGSDEEEVKNSLHRVESRSTLNLLDNKTTVDDTVSTKQNTPSEKMRRSSFGEDSVVILHESKRTILFCTTKIHHQNTDFYFILEPYYQSEKFLISSEVFMKEPDMVYLSITIALLVITVAVIIIATPDVIAHFVVTVVISGKLELFSR